MSLNDLAGALPGRRGSDITPKPNRQPFWLCRERDKWTVTQQYRQWVYIRDDCRCRYCGKSRRRLSVDHFLPVRRGGTNKPRNILTCCWPCNVMKRRLHSQMHRDPYPDSKDWNAALVRLYQVYRESAWPRQESFIGGGKGGRWIEHRKGDAQRWITQRMMHGGD